MSVTVHQTKGKHYYVIPMGKDNVLFESDDASEAIQWAIDSFNRITIESGETPESLIKGKDYCGGNS